jgi:hypothetical protein
MIIDEEAVMSYSFKEKKQIESQSRRGFFGRRGD